MFNTEFNEKKMAAPNCKLWKAMENTECWNSILFSCMKLKRLQLTNTCLHCQIYSRKQDKTEQEISPICPQVAAAISDFEKRLYTQKLMWFFSKYTSWSNECRNKPCFTSRKSRNPRRESKDKMTTWTDVLLWGHQRSVKHITWVSRQVLLWSLKALVGLWGFVLGSFAAGNSLGRELKCCLALEKHAPYSFGQGSIQHLLPPFFL